MQITKELIESCKEVGCVVIQLNFGGWVIQRPSDFEKLIPQKQWEIDSALGILDWKGAKSGKT